MHVSLLVVAIAQREDGSFPETYQELEHLLQRVRPNLPDIEIAVLLPDEEQSRTNPFAGNHGVWVTLGQDGTLHLRSSYSRSGDVYIEIAPDGRILEEGIGIGTTAAGEADP